MFTRISGGKGVPCEVSRRSILYNFCRLELITHMGGVIKSHTRRTLSCIFT